MYLNLLDIMYPIGSIYMSFNDISPADIIGGIWEKIENKVIRAGNDTNTGGSDSHTLTTNEMPSHNHGVKLLGSILFTNGSGVPNGTAKTAPTDWGGGLTTHAVGGGQPHNNLPAYQNIYIWRRIF